MQHVIKLPRLVPASRFLLTLDQELVLLVEAGKNFSKFLSDVFDIRGQTSFLRVFNPGKMCGLLMRAHWTEVHSPEREAFELAPSSFSGAPSPSVSGVKMGSCFEEVCWEAWGFIKCAEDSHQALKHTRGDLPTTQTSQLAFF